MKKALVPVLLCSALAVTSCSWKDDTPAEPTETMTVLVDFQEVHRCSRISPEISVAYAPKGTKFYNVRLEENGAEPRYLGGGLWQADGTGKIPEGALTTHYTGPCPPANQSTEYSYIVSALESEDSQPLAVRIYRFTVDN